MTRDDGAPELTDALEDYLETVYELVRDNNFARVRDIAKARDVRPGSVSPAMRRLAELGLVEYQRREYIGLTPQGEEAARRIAARHQILGRLFEDVLKMERDAAQADACAMEHSLSDEALDRLVRFFEFLRACPEAGSILDRFHKCSVVNDDVPECERQCNAKHERRLSGGPPARKLSALVPGERGRVAQIEGHGDVRQRLLDMGFLPDVRVSVDRVTPAGDVLWVRIGGFQLTVTREEAEAVRVALA